MKERGNHLLCPIARSRDHICDRRFLPVSRATCEEPDEFSLSQVAVPDVAQNLLAVHVPQFERDAQIYWRETDFSLWVYKPTQSGAQMGA